jgi:succinate-acetate transporter protein
VIVHDDDSAPLHDASDKTRVIVRPLGTPLPLGFLGLFVATFAFAALQTGWVPQSEGSKAALAAIALTLPAQLLASVFGFLARDTVAGTGMGILAGTWAVVGLATLTSPPGSTSAELGVVLIGCGIAMLVPAVGAWQRAAASTVMGLAAARFVVTGVAQMNGEPGWMKAAGWVGFGLAAASLYAAFAFELEDVRGRTVLPVGRKGIAAREAAADDTTSFVGVRREPGVRNRL